MNRAGVELTAYAVKLGLPFRVYRQFGFGASPWRETTEQPGWFAAYPDYLKRTPVFLGPDAEKAKVKLDAMAAEFKQPVQEFKPVVEPELVRQASAGRQRRAKKRQEVCHLA